MRCKSTELSGRPGAISFASLSPNESCCGGTSIIAHNLGKLVHNLVVMQGDQRIGGTQPIWPGTVGELLVALPPGRYTLASTLFSDQALGEYGTLTVTS